MKPVESALGEPRAVLAPLDADGCYRAIAARDRRFDGLFFVGVSTTGIYCRPICRARTPGRERCTFYRCGAEAEKAGFRACFRCRPELAPGRAPLDAVPRLVIRAVEKIDSGYLNVHPAAQLAVELGVSSRHLRRVMEAELGISCVELAQSRRLALAKQLLHDTSLPLVEIALASGFGSVRRFNGLFLRRFGCPPSSLRKRRERQDERQTIRLRLDYRPPFDFGALLSFLGARAVPNVELVQGGRYWRTVRIRGSIGTLSVRDEPRHSAVIAELSLSLAEEILEIKARLRALFDLDAEPEKIDAQLARDPQLAKLVRTRPGLRVPGAFDPFEMCVRAVLSQQVSVRAAATFAGRLAQKLGAPCPESSGEASLSRLFPRPGDLAGSTIEHLTVLGITEKRARCIREIAQLCAKGALTPGASGSMEDRLADLLRVEGVGPWTAEVVAMRALHFPDAFPASDLVIRSALGGAHQAEARARAWRPWRAYGAMHIWTHWPRGERS